MACRATPRMDCTSGRPVSQEPATSFDTSAWQSTQAVKHVRSSVLIRDRTVHNPSGEGPLSPRGRAKMFVSRSAAATSSQVQ